MATAAQSRMRVVGSPKTADSSREQEILKEFESFFERHLSAMTPVQLEQYERNAEELMKQSTVERNEAASTPGKERYSLRAHSH